MSEGPCYKRVLVKLSGQALSGNNGQGIDFDTLQGVAEDLVEVYQMGVQIGIVVGGGNIFRGVSSVVVGMDRTSSDHMGMLATCINGVALQNVLEKKGIDTRLQTALEMSAVAEPYIRRKAMRHLEKNRVVIFGGGTGNPFFTTDTAAALRAAEIQADVVLKATNVDSLYDKDPAKHKDAQPIKKMSYIDVLNNNLRVMDTTAISLCMDNKLPIIIFSLKKRGNIAKVLNGSKIGTIIGEHNDSSNKK